MMLDHPSPQDNHARPLRPDGHGVDLPDILHDVDAQLPRRRSEGVEVQHVPQTPVRQRGAEDGYVVFVRPVADRRLVIDLSAEPVYHFARRPAHGRLGPGTLLLLLQHRVEDGDDPVFEQAVVGVRHEQVADAIHALRSQGGAVGGEGAEVGGGEAFDEVFFDAAGGRDNGGDVPVLGEVAKGFA